MKIHSCVQGSAEWKALRLGIPTASEFDSLVTPDFKPRTGQGPETYLYQKLCEKLLGYAPDVNSFAMEQGTILEMEAKPYYSVTHAEVQTVGFITTDDGRIGCSPDGLVGDDGGLEVKCPQPHTHLRYLFEGVVPKEYLAQVHGAMLVTGRPWWDFVSYSRQFKPLVVRTLRHDGIQTLLRCVIDSFLAKFDAKYNALKLERDAETARANADYTAAITKEMLAKQAREEGKP